jgi:hypothetical protein
MTKRRGYIKFTTEAIECGLSEKITPLLNLTGKDYNPSQDIHNIYFEHESLDEVPECCPAIFYTIVEAQEGHRNYFHITDSLGAIRFTIHECEL